jgi:hypothetical protein
MFFPPSASYLRKVVIKMKLFSQSVPVMILAAGLAAGTALPICAAGQSAPPQNYPAGDPYPAPYGDLRGLIDRAQSDLRAAADLEPENDKQRERYRSAQGHLSSFDRHLVKGHFDKGELDKALGEFKGILDHNVLQASSRDALMRDMDDLRAARERRF